VRRTQGVLDVGHVRFAEIAEAEHGTEFRSVER
jgi:hypothetical protein